MESLEYYWSIVLLEGFVNISLWTIDADRVRIIASGEQETWENKEDLVLALNSMLERAVKDYPEDAAEPEKTVFGVIPSWVKEGQIVKDKLDIIRHVCTKLKLAPSGFVVLPEAIAHGVKHNEGAPLNSLVVGIGQTGVDISLFSLGNLIGTIEVGKSENLIGDISEGLARFKSGQHFPSRFIVYGGGDGEIEEILQQLIAYDWESENSEVKFMHTPKFESVNSKVLTSYTSLAGASEIVEISELVYEDGQEEQELALQEEESGEIGEENNNVSNGDLSPEELGFVLGSEPVESTSEPHHNMTSRMQPPGVDRKKLRFKLPSMNILKGIKFPSLKYRGRRHHGGLATQKLPTGNSFKRLFFVLIGLMVVGLVGLIMAWWYLPKAVVTIYVSPRTLRETKEIVMGEGVDTNPDETSIKAEVITLEQSGERTTSTTGTKVVGEKASGKVTIRNGTASGINLKSGTVLKGPDDLLFVLDNSASVSAATSPSQPGSATVTVSAESIGSEYNIAKDSSFSVSNYPSSEVDGVAESEFTGGSSREITAVSQADLDGLEKDLVEQLKEEGRSSIKGQIGSNKEFIVDSVQVGNIERDFNHKVGDEASTVKLNATVEMTGLAVSKEDLFALAQSALGSTVPDGYSLKDDQLKINYDFVSEDEGRWYFDVQFEANLLPHISADDIAAKIAGKYPTQAYDYLSTVPGYVRAEIDINPVLPGRLANLPHVRKNIKIEVGSAQ